AIRFLQRQIDTLSELLANPFGGPGQRNQPANDDGLFRASSRATSSEEARQGDKETRRQGDSSIKQRPHEFLFLITSHSFSLSPCLLVSLSSLFVSLSRTQPGDQGGHVSWQRRGPFNPFARRGMLEA